MKNKNAASEPELSRPLRIEKISANGVEESIVAKPDERAALAARFGLIEIGRLEAKLHVMPKQAGAVFEAHGQFSADIVQRCVVSLEPLPTHVEQKIEALFAEPVVVATGSAEQDMTEDDIDAIADGIIDLGELVAQNLGLALDPYPRKPDLPSVEAEYGEPVVKTSPFAKLVALKDKNKD